jgi:hypothetical protein
MALHSSKNSTQTKQRPLRPIAPYSPTSKEALAHAFDREMGKPIPAGQLKTYAQALAQYHLRPEGSSQHRTVGIRPAIAGRCVEPEQIHGWQKKFEPAIGCEVREISRRAVMSLGNPERKYCIAHQVRLASQNDLRPAGWAQEGRL